MDIIESPGVFKTTLFIKDEHQKFGFGKWTNPKTEKNSNFVTDTVYEGEAYYRKGVLLHRSSILYKTTNLGWGAPGGL